MGAERLEAVAFDIDGTLYPDWAMYLFSLPALIRDPLLMYRYGRMRKGIRAQQHRLGSSLSDPAKLQFRTLQTIGVLEQMGRTADEAAVAKMERRIDHHIYAVWAKSFAGIRPYRGVIELFSYLKGRDIRTGLLSDFPPGVKPKALGVEAYTDVICSAEETGRLKPDPEPFKALVERLGIGDRRRVLYVGNSYEKDITGARNAGLQTAYIVRSRRKAASASFAEAHPDADLIFSRYADLQGYISRLLDS